MISSVEGWLKGRLAEAGFGHIGVRRLDGNASQSQKERTMEAFKSGWDSTCPTILQFLNCCRFVTVLFCSEVAAMGVHCPDLCLGVSIGKEPHHNHHHKHTFSSHRCLDHSLEVCSVLVEREIHRAGLFESWSKWKLRWVVLRKKTWLNLIICHCSHERC